jgi:hypothetical protein
MMKVKGKSKQGIQGATPIEFYSNLPFQECLSRLQNDPEHLKVDLQQQTVDRYRFLIMLKGEAANAANLSGTLQEWGDAATRFEGMLFSKSIHVANPSSIAGKREKSRIQNIYRWVFGLVFLIYLAFIILRPSDLLMASYTALAIITLLVGAISWLWTHRSEKVYGHQLMHQLELLLNDERKAKGNLDENYDNSRREAGIHPDRAGKQSDPQTPH